MLRINWNIKRSTQQPFSRFRISSFNFFSFRSRFCFRRIALHAITATAPTAAQPAVSTVIIVLAEVVVGKHMKYLPTNEIKSHFLCDFGYALTRTHTQMHLRSLQSTFNRAWLVARIYAHLFSSVACSW